MDTVEMNQRLNIFKPAEIVEWAVEFSKKPIITTNFRPYESAILHLVTQIKPDIPVIWCDTGYNTPQTYKHADELIKKLKLNIQIYVPKQTVGYRNATLGIPEINTPEHQLFSEQVKLEPFRRAMAEWKPDLWFTNLRKGQTAFRDNIDIVSKGKDTELKVSPFYHFTDLDLDVYLKEFDLPNETNYFDPTKALENRECGIHV
ncbi:MAG: phosphoadenosine phosphosulfate reductase family protein [Weeksellaceae bacterium]|jgi:phosphoadenosine phosphosulfate reductase|nr:phosphoadenosine phosphosulfate reductase family protein [Weeksellaceae bacterium]MDX9704541.1 phosphoadenosine phosphosulfate reductase family protein [Weeksellaceae bacterium]